MKRKFISHRVLVLVLYVLLTALPWAQAAYCNAHTITGSPSSSDIAAFLKKALSQPASGVCAGGFPPTNPLTNVFNADEMDFNVTRSTATGTLNSCETAFADIISQCVQGQNVWGGQWSVPSEFYSINNSIYPGNAMIIPGASSQVAPSSSPTTTVAGPSTIASGGFVISAGTNGPITIPSQTTTESGIFSTSYISGVTADMVTTTTLSSQSGPTILPIWCCPGCVAAAAGILILPAAAPLSGGLIPTPPGFSALSIGPDGRPTATGPTSGTQPSGDPRTRDPTASATKTPSQSPSDSNIQSSTATASESPVQTPDVTGSCQYWDVGNSKRDFRVGTVFKIIQHDYFVKRDLFKRAEGEMSVPSPLKAAIQAIGGPDGITSADGLTLVTTRFPRPDMENRFITGLQGRVTQDIQKNYNGQIINMRKGDLFRSRWDYDPGDSTTTPPTLGKGVHVNAEFFGSTTTGTTKIAFFLSNKPIVDNPTNRNNMLFQQVINDQSNSLDYQMKPNAAGHVFTPQERTGETDAATQAKALQSMAQALAQKWADSSC